MATLNCKGSWEIVIIWPETKSRRYVFGASNFAICHNSGGASGKESACHCRRHKRLNLGSNPGLGRSPGEGNGNPLQYSCQENSSNRGAWWAIVHGSQKVRAHTHTFAMRCCSTRHSRCLQGLCRLMRIKWKPRAFTHYCLHSFAICQTFDFTSSDLHILNMFPKTLVFCRF